MSLLLKHFQPCTLLINSILHCFLYSKSDENTEEERLGFILPAHEYFHQSMVVADCENELIRDKSRGLEGGSFFAATILNRKEAKSGKGKDSIDSLKDFYFLKSDARFCHYFIYKYGLDPAVDNTPDLLKTASNDNKETFIHGKVIDTLKDLLPYFRNCSSADPQLDDHPLQEGRRSKYQVSRHPPTQEIMEQPALIDQAAINITIEQLASSLPEEDIVNMNMEKVSVTLSGTRSTTVFQCKICSFQSKYRTVCITHVGQCLTRQANITDTDTATSQEEPEVQLNTSSLPAVPETNGDESKGDAFWNYKNAEFFMDAMFAITTSFERYGDGLGCFIANKVLLPIIHGLRHSNYSNSIHRFITRILCEATPKEALKIIHERFSNRTGKPGKNVNRDKRMEYRIGTAKKLIANLGPNFSQDSVQKVNSTLDMKEELFLATRLSHGVDIRSGRHCARSDAKDYDMMFSQLTETRAHMLIEGRVFGDFNFAEDIMEDKKFDKAEFYRWLTTKNKEAMSSLSAKKRKY